MAGRHSFPGINEQIRLVAISPTDRQKSGGMGLLVDSGLRQTLLGWITTHRGRCPRMKGKTVKTKTLPVKKGLVPASMEPLETAQKTEPKVTRPHTSLVARMIQTQHQERSGSTSSELLKRGFLYLSGNLSSYARARQ
jgi:hypothetical protein